MTNMNRGKVAGIALIVVLWAALRLTALDRPFWMDESFSASLAFQPTERIVYICSKDVHPPLYYLALRAWNGLATTLSGGAEKSEWSLEDFNLELERLETAGTFDWRNDEGDWLHTAGVFPNRPLFWEDVPLAPLWNLRLLTIFASFTTLILLYRLARLLWPKRPEIAWIAAVLFAVSGYAITWDTIIRSYSLAAALSAGLAFACFRGARTGRWRLAAPWISALATAAFLTHYATQLLFPAIALGAWMIGGWKKRDFVCLFGSFAAAGAVILATWDRSYFGQFDRMPDQPWLSRSIDQSVLEEMNAIILNYWRLLFTEGVWRWLLGIDDPDRLNPLVALSPNQPILYGVAFMLYALAMGVNFYKITVFRADRVLLAIALCAFFPAFVMLAGNALKPAFFRLHARHFYPLTPFFYLFLSLGWAEAGKWLRSCVMKRSEKTKFES